MVSKKAQTRRLVYASLIALTIFFGLASRRYAFFLPPILAKNAGDILYAMMVFWLIGFISPTLSTPRAFFAAVTFCFGIEFSKLCQLPWLVAARHSAAGALVLGHGFHASNLVCYLLGAAIAAVIKIYLRRRPA